MNKKIKIGLLGYGVVGSGFIDVVEKNKCKNDIEISRILRCGYREYRRGIWQ